MHDNTVWIVEIDFEDDKGWTPTVGVALTRADGRVELQDWLAKNPGYNERLRLRKYVRA